MKRYSKFEFAENVDCDLVTVTARLDSKHNTVKIAQANDLIVLPINELDDFIFALNELKKEMKQ